MKIVPSKFSFSASTVFICIRLFRSRSLTSSSSFEGDSFLQAATHTSARVAHYPRRIIFNDAVEFYDSPPRFTGRIPRWVYVREGSFNDRGWILAVVPVINDCTYEVSFSLGNWKEVCAAGVGGGSWSVIGKDEIFRGKCARRGGGISTIRFLTL